jgi:hypothetical protein
MRSHSAEKKRKHNHALYALCANSAEAVTISHGSASKDRWALEWWGWLYSAGTYHIPLLFRQESPTEGSPIAGRLLASCEKYQVQPIWYSSQGLAGGVGVVWARL